MVCVFGDGPVSHRLPIHQVHHGFELMRSRKDDVIKVAIVFDG